MPIPRISQRANALSRPQFSALLRTWYDKTREETIGSTAILQGNPWLIIAHGKRYYHLNADTTRQGVFGYLQLLETYGEEMVWAIQKTGKQHEARVVFGPHQRTEDGFFLFAYDQ